MLCAERHTSEKTHLLQAQSTRQDVVSVSAACVSSAAPGARTAHFRRRRASRVPKNRYGRPALWALPARRLPCVLCVRRPEVRAHFRVQLSESSRERCASAPRRPRCERRPGAAAQSAAAQFVEQCFAHDARPGASGSTDGADAAGSRARPGCSARLVGGAGAACAACRFAPPTPTHTHTSAVQPFSSFLTALDGSSRQAAGDGSLCACSCLRRGASSAPAAAPLRSRFSVPN